jgi:hypothetical protein
MSKKKRSTKKGGPYLAAALFCENVIEDKENVLSAIRLVDRMLLNLVGAPPDFPSKENRLQVPVTILLCFKTGDFPGEHTVSIVATSPSGKKNPVVDQKLAFTTQKNGGANWIARTTLAVFSGGVFWFDVYVDNKLITRMPLEILINKSTPPPITPPSDPRQDKQPSPQATKDGRKK